MNKPLTEEQTAFAAEHHDLVLKFLRRKGYAVNDFYDIVIFGYLRAVRSYLERVDLQTYAFSTIANWCMRSDISNYFRSLNCQKNRAEICNYNEDSDAPNLNDSVWESVCRNMAAEEVREVLTPQQSRIAYLKVSGYNNREISRQCGLKPAHVGREIKAAGDAVRNLRPDLCNLIAA